MRPRYQKPVTSYQKTRFNFYLKFVWCLVTGIWILQNSKIALACPGCSEITRFGAEAAKAMRFGDGIAWSMLLMFLVPALLISGIVFVIVRGERKRLQAQQSDNSSRA